MLNMVKIPKHEVDVCRNAPWKSKDSTCIDGFLYLSMSWWACPACQLLRFFHLVCIVHAHILDKTKAQTCTDASSEEPEKIVKSYYHCSWLWKQTNQNKDVRQRYSSWAHIDLEMWRICLLGCRFTADVACFYLTCKIPTATTTKLCGSMGDKGYLQLSKVL